MNEENRNKRSNNKGITIFEVIIIVLVIGFMIFLLLPKLQTHPTTPGKEVICINNLKHFSIAFKMYAKDNSNTYPTHGKWCDLIKPYLFPPARGTDYKVFQCPAAISKAIINKEKEKAKCHYAMNPNCEPNSPPDTVLLFETKGGWNLSGGKELSTDDNHSSNTCSVLFNDGSFGRLRKEEIPNLNWNAERKNE